MGNLAYDPVNNTYLLNSSENPQPGPDDTVMDGCCCNARDICYACASCITVVISTTSEHYALTAINAATSSNACHKTYIATGIKLNDSDQQPTANTVDIRIIVTANDMYMLLKFYIDGSQYNHVFLENHAPDVDDETFGCDAWGEDAVPFSSDLFKYEDPDWVQEDAFTAKVYFGPPVDEAYHKGNPYELLINNLYEISVEDCSGVSDPLDVWDGQMGAGGPWSYTGTHLGKDINVELTFDSTQKRYRLVITCSAGANILLDEYKDKCGGPVGTYGVLVITEV